jgi:hypothetical protein
MTAGRTLFCVGVGLGLLAMMGGQVVFAQSTAFTYQGELKRAGVPVVGTVDLAFGLWDEAVGGLPVGSTLEVDDVPVVGGVFTVGLDFGAGAFGGDRWLEVAVRSPAGSGGFTVLSPRQQLTAAPYALQTRGLFVDEVGRVGVNTDLNRGQLNVVGGEPAFAGLLTLVNETCLSASAACDAYISAWAAEYFDNDGATGRLWALGNDLSGDRDVHFFNQLEAGLGLGTAGRRKDLYVDALGKVGIGTTTPTAELDVAGTLAVDAIRLADGGELDGANWGPTESAIAFVRLGNGVELGTLATVIDQATPDIPPYFSVTNVAREWQSFTAGVTGELATVELRRLSAAEAGVVSIYEGAGTDGLLLGQQAIPATPVRAWQSPEPFDPPVPIVAGNVYTIALESPSTRWMHVASDPYAGGRLWAAADRDALFRTYAIDPAVDPVAETRLWVYAPNGNVGIGRIPTANALEVQGEASKSTAGGWLANSDGRIKTGVQSIDDALDKLSRLRLVRFQYTDAYRASHPGVEARPYYNVIAQEFKELFPGYVRGSGEHLPDGSEILQVDTYPLTIYAAAAIQELHAQLAAREAELAQVRAAHAELAARLARIEARLAERDD